MGTWALVLRKRSTRFKKIVHKRFCWIHWRTNSWSIRGETRLSLSQPACLQLHPAAVQRLREHISQYTCSGQRDRGRVNLMKQMQRWLNHARVLECVRASFVSDCCLSFFLTLLSSTHTHNHTITQTWLHKHPADFQPRPSRSSSFLFCHIYNGAVISCSLEQPAGPGGEPLRRMTLRLRSVCATLHRHAAGSLVLRASTSVFYIHSKRKCFGNSRV